MINGPNPEQLARLAGWLSLLLVFVVAFQAASLSWRLIPKPQHATTPVSGVASTIQITASVDYQRMANWHLFGETAREAPPPTPVVEAPETRLNLRLVGILHSDSDSQARAIIGQSGEVEQVYGIGDPIAPGVTLATVERNRVILSRDGRLESLSMPSDAPPNSPSAADLATTLPGTFNATDESAVNASDIANQLRNQLVEDPNTALSQIALASPYVQDGRFLGFRLRPGRDRRILGKLGLRSGDVVTEINGNRLNSPADGMALMQALINADQIAIKVLRNGEEIPFTFYLNQ